MIPWLKQALIFTSCCCGILLFIGISIEALMRQRVASQYPAPGKLVDIGGHKLQLDCRGSGSPTVILESGIGSLGSLGWSAVHDSIAVTTRVCAYNRAGILWSDTNPGKFESKNVASDLHAALIASGEKAPWVMVGHSMGGPYIMKFTELYHTEVAGIVFVDATHPEHFQRRQAVMGDAEKTSPLGEMLKTTLAGTGIVRLIPSSIPSTVPPLAAEIDRAYQPQSIGSVLKELLAVDNTLQAAEGFRQLGHRPLVVLTAMSPLSSDRLQEISDRELQQHVQRRKIKVDLHRDLATWSTNSRHEILADSSHLIQFDRPDAVIKAVNEVVQKVRNHQ